MKLTETFSRTDDFDKRIDVIPVSILTPLRCRKELCSIKPRLQLAQQAPQLYDMGKLHQADA